MTGADDDLKASRPTKNPTNPRASRAAPYGRAEALSSLTSTNPRRTPPFALKMALERPYFPFR